MYEVLHSIDSVYFRTLSATAYSKDIFNELNTFLSARSYVTGFVATEKDLELAETVEAVVMDTAGLVNNFPHVSRWWKHIAFLRREGSLLARKVSGMLPAYPHAFS